MLIVSLQVYPFELLYGICVGDADGEDQEANDPTGDGAGVIDAESVK